MNSKKKKTLKLWVRVLLLCLIILMFCSGLILLIKEFISKPTNKEAIYSYTINRNLNYSVELYDNSFIEDKFLGMNNTYMSDLVKKIVANYEYKLLGSNNIDLNYNYTITATINGKHKINNEYTESNVWSKSYLLYESDNIHTFDNHIIVDESVDIDYHLYDNEVSNFRKQLKMSINASLDVVLSLNVEGNIDDNFFKDSSTYVMKIPLNQQAFNIASSITPDTDNSKTYNLYKFVKEDNIDYSKIVISSLNILFSIILFIVLYKKIFIFKKKNYYILKKKKILKDFGEVIVEVAEPIIEDEFNVILVKSFDEMIDLEEELRIPIMFYDYITDDKGDFVIMHNNCIYKYTLNNEKNDVAK